MKISQQYHIFTLSNGMRVVHRQTDGNVAYTGVVVNAGTRDESPGKFGLAHFVEHTIFKGTARRSSFQVSNRMEEVGGELNAYTSKEETVIYTSAPAAYADRAVELLADMIGHPAFPPAEVNREKDVVIEEIKSYLDNPGETAYDEFDDAIYRGSDLGHTILGSPESVNALTPADCADFIERFYTPTQMVAYSMSPQAPEKVLRNFERHFGTIQRPLTPRIRPVPQVVQPFNILHDRNGHQAHTIVGCRTFARTDERRFPLFLLNNHLGGPNMSSLLNRELREKKGLVYSVDSTLALMSNCGIMQIYFGADKRYVQKCRKLIFAQLSRLAETTIKPRLFERIKRQYAGQLLVSGDNLENQAMNMAKNLLYFGKVHDIARTAERITQVSAEEVRDVAQILLPSLCSTLTIQ